MVLPVSVFYKKNWGYYIIIIIIIIIFIFIHIPRKSASFFFQERDGKGKEGFIKVYYFLLFYCSECRPSAVE